MSVAATAFGQLLRDWRGSRGLSQLDLALSAGVSSRHISFIETGRSKPSREMVLRLAETLELALRERNGALIAAGFAPYYRESTLESPDIAPVRRALDLILRSHEPFPAFVLDRGWNIVLSNRAHQRLLPLLLPDGKPVGETPNVMELVLAPDLLRPRIVNWPVVAHVLGHRVRRQLRAPGLSDDHRRSFEAWLAYPGVGNAMDEASPPPDAAVVIPLEFALDDHEPPMAWFSTIATLGTPQDITLDELLIESLFPADDVTERIARELAAADT